MLRQIEIDFNAVQFYNTTREDDASVALFKKANQVGNLEILAVFEANPDKSFTPYEVGDELLKNGNKMLQSSIKRGITDLTSAGILINTGVKVIERYGRPNFRWKLKQADEKL